MSGPIVRKYGFPNFEQIFGKREIEHGIEDDPDPASGPHLPPDLPHTGEPVDTSKPRSAGQMAPTTEFGSAVE